ncbi:unnamed protein product [Rotaria socialis]|uniref:Glycoprotein endo-alpha-1,2-mannosidase n=1 Tax=Rotaria socialis TaxID=392032 RepID=A0A818WXF1_9BILA|nr:unnamed protein product [Rotaria socialis]CAF3732574.1 unnamed protein product [Rotaria socialis]CAF4291695.1 unnamed protein product [Rotaria socialis]CAF4508284.1 unnamed protein product [Rotaria socialis]
MWQLRTRRHRIRWFAIGFILIVLVWCSILYRSLSINYEQDAPHPHSPSVTTESLFLYEIDNLDTFIRHTPVKYNYHIFYYPWYGTPEYDGGQYLHWNHRRLAHWNREKAVHYPQHRHQPPDDIGSNFYPFLGPYSSRSRVILDKHMRMIRMSGAGTLSISWYPPGMADDEGRPSDDIIPLLLNKAGKYQLKVCFHIEPYQNRTVDNVIHWTQYILRQYGSHQAFYRFNGKGVFYIYDSYRISAHEWRQKLFSNEKMKQEAFFVGLILKSNECQPLASSGFDAAYSYFAANGFTEASTSQQWTFTVGQCKSIPFIPSVGPGYIDTNVRPWNGGTTRPRQNGEYYKKMFNDLPKGNDRIVTITSFNEWGEGTQIEPAVERSISKNITYESYHQGPFTYIYLTRELIFAT